MVEKIARNSGMTYLDSIVHVCEISNLDVEDCKKFLSPSIVEKLEAEAMGLNLIDKGNTIDV